MTIVTNSGNLITGPGTTTLVGTSIIQGVNLDQANGDFLIVDDPSIEAALPEGAGPNPAAQAVHGWFLAECLSFAVPHQPAA